MDDLDFALMGFYAGNMAGEKIPVFNGVPGNAPSGGLLGMGATIPSYMYHVVGVTPEAGTLEQAFMGNKPEQTFRFGKGEWSAMQQKYGAVAPGDVDIVMVGCPHCSLKQVVEYAGLLDGNKVSANTEFLILTSNAVRHTVKESGYYDIIERSGAKLVNMCSMFTIHGDKPALKVLTNSSTYRMYGAGSPMLVSPDDCIRAALTGKFVPGR
jgi:predicted aconitase